MDTFFETVIFGASFANSEALPNRLAGQTL
jgi:hypothetical protein